MSCKKECYDKKTAKTILNQRLKEHKGERRIYFHEECNAWHLTSQEEYDEVVQLKEKDLVYKEKWLKLKNPD
tara:strand:+ start:2650 stop:2865 length:216 start_codon:yes stop_codon:yes gene_type:complete